LIDSTLQSALHLVVQVDIGPARYCHGHGQYHLDVLEGKTVLFDAFKRLRLSNQSLDIVGFDFEDACATDNDNVKVGNLLVPRGAIGVSLERYGIVTTTTGHQTVQALGIKATMAFAKLAFS
jgi:hypothetical protein